MLADMIRNAKDGARICLVTLDKDIIITIQHKKRSGYVGKDIEFAYLEEAVSFPPEGMNERRFMPFKKKGTSDEN